MKYKNVIIGLSILLVILITLKYTLGDKGTLENAPVIERTYFITHEIDNEINNEKDEEEETYSTVEIPTVPVYLKGEDSIAYIENHIYKSPITANDLLKLAEVHSVEDMLFYYNNPDLVNDNPEYIERYTATHQDSAAMRLANRFIRMYELVDRNGNANDKIEWAVAVNSTLRDFCKAVPTVPFDSAVNEISRVADKFSSQTQIEMNFQCYIFAAVEEYRTREAYRQWILIAPYELKDLVIEEYESWNCLNEARFAFWENVSYNQEWYSMKPMEIHGYYQDLLHNRSKELMIEQDIILKGKTYKKKGVTVRTNEWEKWITDHSVPEDYEFLKEFGDIDRIPSDSVVAAHVDELKTCFNRWLKARQAIAAQLPSEQGKSYDNLTADIHSMMIGKLESIVP